MKKYALFHWYQGEGNKYTFLGNLTKDEFKSSNHIEGKNFSLIKVESTDIEEEIWNSIYTDSKGNKYTTKSGSVWTQS